MAFCAGSTPQGMRLGPVYTPKEYRNQGYATACVQTLSKNMLVQGYKYCFLFTDLANPTSNHLYQKIGYQPLINWDEYSFIVKD